MIQRKIPLRKCVACQTMIPKQHLIRVVRNPNGKVLVDPSGKAAGRGAYLCKKKDCFDIVKQRNTLEKSLKARITDDVYDLLEEEWMGLNAFEP